MRVAVVSDVLGDWAALEALQRWLQRRGIGRSSIVSLGNLISATEPASWREGLAIAAELGAALKGPQEAQVDAFASWPLEVTSWPLRFCAAEFATHQVPPADAEVRIEFAAGPTSWWSILSSPAEGSHRSTDAFDSPLDAARETNGPDPIGGRIESGLAVCDAAPIALCGPVLREVQVTLGSTEFDVASEPGSRVSLKEAGIPVWILEDSSTTGVGEQLHYRSWPRGRSLAGGAVTKPQLASVHRGRVLAREVGEETDETVRWIDAWQEVG